MKKCWTHTHLYAMQYGHFRWMWRVQPYYMAKSCLFYVEINRCRKNCCIANRFWRWNASFQWTCIRIWFCLFAFWISFALARHDASIHMICNINYNGYKEKYAFLIDEIYIMKSDLKSFIFYICSTKKEPWQKVVCQSALGIVRGIIFVFFGCSEFSSFSPHVFCD